jgi:hypothetical protein
MNRFYSMIKAIVASSLVNITRSTRPLFLFSFLNSTLRYSKSNQAEYLIFEFMRRIMICSKVISHREFGEAKGATPHI